MTKLEYRVSFVTPAFLGNASQQAQWRTPPVKALIRHWWRVANAKRFDYDHMKMREEEGLLFGNAWLDSKNNQSRHSKSNIRLRLIPWGNGQVTSEEWPGGPIESISTTKDGKTRVSADVYLGFGAVRPPSKKEGRLGVTLRGSAIGPTEQARFQLYPGDKGSQIKDTLQLIAWFGTLGSRARNGWGSLQLDPENNAPAMTRLPRMDHTLLQSILRPWQECLMLDWPHALGSDAGRPLVWMTSPFPDWRKALGCLANIKVEVRRIAKTFKGPEGIGGIHLLGYPAGKKGDKWDLKLDGEARLASPLRLKVLKGGEGLVGMVAHVPCGVPQIFAAKLTPRQRQWIHENQEKVWKAIHGHLTNHSRVRPLS